MAEREFIRTDLATELGKGVDIRSKSGISYSEKSLFGMKLADMSITSEKGSRIMGKPVGRYITLECGSCWRLSNEEKQNAVKVISDHISLLLPQKRESILCVGLGNREIIADALGPLCIDSLTVTRHIKEYDSRLFESLGYGEIAAIAPGVVGQTGIETSELILGAVDKVRPDAVIAIDALAARSVDRLGSTVQLSDNGIAPGSGIGNKRRAISRDTLGVPVIAVGVPTVVDSATLVYDALSLAGIEEISPSLERVLENGRSFFVSLKESDVAVRQSAELLSSALDMVFCRA